jgi:hypothetical protein
LKIAALDAGLLGNGRRATLVGAGASLVRWREALGARIETYHEVRKPIPKLAPNWRFPLVLALMAPAARARWRASLEMWGRRELADFIFVA